MTDVLAKFPIPKEYLHALVDGMEMDIVKKRYDTFDELSKYCYHAASVVGLICIEIFGYRAPQTKEYAIHLGKALQMTNILRDVGDDAQKQRIYLPAEDYTRFGLSEADLLQRRYSPQFVEFMRFEAERTAQFFQKATELYEWSDHHLLFPAEIMRKIYYRIYQKIIANDFDVFSQRIRVSNKHKMVYALQEWMTARWVGLVQWNPAS
jgi:phytoene synthase